MRKVFKQENENARQRACRSILRGAGSGQDPQWSSCVMVEVVVQSVEHLLMVSHHSLHITHPRALRWVAFKDAQLQRRSLRLHMMQAHR